MVVLTTSILQGACHLFPKTHRLCYSHHTFSSRVILRQFQNIGLNLGFFYGDLLVSFIPGMRLYDFPLLSVVSRNRGKLERELFCSVSGGCPCRQRCLLTRRLEFLKILNASDWFFLLDDILTGHPVFNYQDRGDCQNQKKQNDLGELSFHFD